MRRRRWLLGVALFIGLLAPTPADALKWSGPELIDPGTTTSVASDLGGVNFVPSNAITGVSCPSRSLCVAVDNRGNVLHSASPAAANPHWRLARVSSAGFTGISCPTAALCVAVGFEASDNEVVVATSTHATGPASRWHRAVIQASAPLHGISCPTPSLCVGVDNLGSLVTSTDPLGGAAAWRGEGSGFDTGGVSCSSQHFCATIGDAVHTSTHPRRGASSWTMTTVPTLEVGQVTSLSCASPRLCAAVDDAGNVIISADPARGRAGWRLLKLDEKNVTYCTCDAYAVGLTGVSCPTATYCAAVDGTGNVLVADKAPARSSWRITRVGGGADSATWVPFAGISCRSTALCVAYDGDGDVSVGTPKPAPVHSRRACDAHKPNAGVVAQHALIYAVAGPTTTDYFACERPRGPGYPLGQTWAPIAEYGSNNQTGDFEAAGTLAAAQTETGDADAAQCSKYGNLDCPPPARSITVLDTHSGRHVGLATGPSASNLVLSSSAAVAWLEQVPGGGSTRLLATVLRPSGADSFTASPREVDRGAIDPSSVRFDGLTLSWTNAGHPASITLG